MPLSDPIADLLTRMRNAIRAGKTECAAPWSRHRVEICDALVRAGFLSEVQTESEGVEKMLIVHFHPERMPQDFVRVSKVGRRFYSGHRALRPVLRGYGVAVLSTSEGVLTDEEAKAKGVGGEVICTVS